VTPEPSQTGRSFGAGVASDLNVRNLFGRAVSAGIAGRFTRDFRAARAYTTAPAMFGLPIVTNVFLSRSREQSGGTEAGSLRFVTDTTGLTLEQRVRPARKIEVSYGFTFERKHVFDPNADPLDVSPDTDIKVNVGRLRWTTIVDTRNDLVDATKGWFHSSDFEHAPSALGSDLHFMKYLLQHRYYRILGPVVLASSARLGFATAFEQTLIRSERFFAGGGNSVRGYADDELSPRDPFFGDAAGGNALLVLNQEVRFPIVKFLRGVGFVDAGRAFETAKLVRLSDLGVGTGFGLRVQTPVALIRVDFGVPLNGAVSPRRGRWFFSIGQAF
jgi:outer membrane protein assembly factor BamA